MIAAAVGTDITKFAKTTANPLGHLSDDGKAKLKARGIDPAPFAAMRACLLSGRKQIINATRTSS